MPSWRRDRLRHPPDLKSPKALDPYLSERWRRHREHDRRPWLRRLVLSARQPQRRPHRRLAAERPAAGLGPRLHALPVAGRLGHGLRRAAAAARRRAGSATSSTRRRCRRRSTSGRSTSGSTPSRACALAWWSPYEDGELAVAEIERRGDASAASSRSCCAIRTSEPLGRRKYWPMYEAADAQRPADRHPLRRRRAATPITGAGWPSFYLEDHAGHVDGVPGPGHQPHLRGRLRAVPEAEDRADRGWLRLAAVAVLAARLGLDASCTTRCRT